MRRASHFVRYCEIVSGEMATDDGVDDEMVGVSLTDGQNKRVLLKMER
jgi:hypothetical protein